MFCAIKNRRRTLPRTGTTSYSAERRKRDVDDNSGVGFAAIPARAVSGRKPTFCLPAMWLVVVYCVAVGMGRAQNQQALCDRGEGSFEARLHNGAGVNVTAARSRGFAARTCSAAISWKGQNLTAVASAGQVDIDVMGGDLGLGMPVVALQTREADDDWRASYFIYSLDKEPHLLFTITGGDFYRAADSDFNGHAEIWTRDAVAADGFDDLTYSDFDFPPTVVLRFDQGRLVDVSAEYPSQYDEQIATLQTELGALPLGDFRKSDGKLLNGSLAPQELVRLQKIKVKVLEIADAYLYSGREEQAWTELAEAWPPSDVDRVKAAIMTARAKGIDAQAAAVAPARHERRRGHLVVYNTTATVPEGGNVDTNYRGPGHPVDMAGLESIVDSPPRPILLLRQNLAKATETVDLVIDAVGKVQSVKSAGAVIDPELVEAAKQWKFIPAFKNGRPVACRDEMDVAPEL